MIGPQDSDSNPIQIRKNRHCYLPEEVIEGILVRLPFKLIFRFRCVCKLWFNLIKNSRLICYRLIESDVTFITLCFINKSKLLDDSWYLNLFLFHVEEEEVTASATKRLTRFRTGVEKWLDYVLCSDSLEVEVDAPLLPMLSFKLPYSYQQPSCKFTSELEFVGHCNGIMCLSHRDFTLLANPLLKEVKTLSNPDPPRLVGFGFDNIKTMDFQVVRVFTYPRQEAEVYNLKTDVWKTVVLPLPFSFRGRFKRCTFFNGVMHWCVKARVEGDTYRWQMLSFNLATELFELTEFPQTIHTAKEYPQIALFVLNQESLAFVDCLSFYSFERAFVNIWTMNNKHGEETTTWTKIYSDKCILQLEKPISFVKGHELLHEKESGKLYLYDLINDSRSLVLDYSQVSQYNTNHYSKPCMKVEAGVLCGSSLVSISM